MLSGLARGTASSSVLGDATDASIRVLDLKSLGKAELLSAVRLIGRAPSELDARDQRVVVPEVRADERLEPGEGVELVEVEPPMPSIRCTGQ